MRSRRPDLLEEVAARARDDRREDGLLVRVAREDDDTRLRKLGADLAARLDTRAVGQADIHDDDVRLELARHLERLGDAAGLGHDLEAFPPIEQGDETLADDLVVVDDEKAQGTGERRLGHDAFLHAPAPAGSIGRRRLLIGTAPQDPGTEARR